MEYAVIPLKEKITFSGIMTNTISDMKMCVEYKRVSQTVKTDGPFQSRIHINGDFIIGTYGTEYEAAIAYNKAADMLEPVFPVSYTRNYIEDISHTHVHMRIGKISKRVIEYVKRLAEKVNC